jgi:hypothetical protein
MTNLKRKTYVRRLQLTDKPRGLLVVCVSRERDVINLQLNKNYCKNKTWLLQKKGKLVFTCNFSGSFWPFMVVISSGSERICFARVP